MSRREAHAAIVAGAWLMERNRRYWRERRPAWCRMELAVASYNSGAGNLAQAQKAARRDGWPARCLEDGIRRYMPSVVRPDAAHENEVYVAKVLRLERAMMGW